MEEDLGPFEIREINGRQTLWLRGTKEGRKRIEAEYVPIILDSIRKEWDIYIEHAIICDGLDIKKIADRLSPDANGKWIVPGNVKIMYSDICGNVYFGNIAFVENVDFKHTGFYGHVSFGECHFNKWVSFTSSIFHRGAQFDYAVFDGKITSFARAVFAQRTHFNSAAFNGVVSFTGADLRGVGPRFRERLTVDFPNAAMKRPAGFGGVKLKVNSMPRGLWNMTVGKAERLRLPVTWFEGFNTNTMMDAASNPYLKRYIDDEQWIESWRYSGRLRRGLFYIWEAMCHCGRSIGLWALWSALIAVLFGILYAQYPFPSWLSWVPGLKSLLTSVPHPELYITPRELDAAGELIRETTGFTPYYFSIVTFTTLGFGDVIPLDLAGEVWLAIEVVLGYVMLGGLISIFANKLARRS